MTVTQRAICWTTALLLAGGATSPASARQAGTPTADPPPVVFISGLNATASTWNALAGQVSDFTTTFAFERPGYAGTPLAPSDADGVRTDVEVAAMLDEALSAHGIRRPVVLVAHSLGGPYELAFARLHPRDVAGVILVDPRLKELAANSRAAGRGWSPPSIPPGMPAYLAAELRGMQALEESDPDPRDISALGDIPIVVISQNTGQQPQLGRWQETLRGFAAAVKNGRYVLAEKSGHAVFRDEPELVLREIRDVVERASTKR